MRQQFFDLAVLLRRQASQHIFQVGIRIMPIELGALNQAHHRSGALARTQGACEQPVAATIGDRANLILDPIVIDRQLRVIQKQRERTPALETVIERFGGIRGSLCRDVHKGQSGNPHGSTGHHKTVIQNSRMISENDSKVAV